MSAAPRTVSAPRSAEETGRRVAEVLDRLTASAERETRDAAEELVRLLMDLYGAGLTRVVSALDQQEPSPSGDVLSHLLDDELVASLLVLHDLHPESRTTRVARALRKAGSAQPSEEVGFDVATGVLRLRASSGGDSGCPNTTRAVRLSIEAALSCYAPEVTSVVWVETAPAAPPLLEIGRRPPKDAPGFPSTPARAR